MLAVDKKGRTLLHLLVLEDRSTELLERLTDLTPEQVSVVDKSGESALHVAARCGKVESAALLIEAKADLNTPSRGKLDTPLILAACHGHLSCAELLVRSHADITSRTRQGLTAEQWAKKFNHQDIVCFLRSVGSG